MSVANPVLRSN